MITELKNGWLFLIMMALLPAFAFAGGGAEKPAGHEQELNYENWADTELERLEDMSVDALRERRYGSEITIVDWLGQAGGSNEYQAFYSADGTPSYNT
jgi:hypothetical protein